MYKLLVADDEQKDRNIVRLLVEKQYGDLFEILEAKSGTQALEILRNDQIDLLLLDMNMPGLSGMGVIRELKKPTYLIILTAYSFFDYARLITSAYPAAAAVSYDPAAFAHEIAYSKYISEKNGDNRTVYCRLLARLAVAIGKLIPV